MNTDFFWQSLQTGLRVSLGATASAWETLQDPEKRQESLTTLQAEFQEKVREWVAKGEITEQEARNFVDSFLRQPPGSSNPSPEYSPEQQPESSGSAGDAQESLEELTNQIANLRSELENLRNSSHQ